MAASYIVYGSPGSGSVPMEAALTLIGQPYEIIGETALREVAQNPEVFAVNPLGQVPALVVPIGEIMTESRDPGLACRPLPRGTIGPTYVTQEATGLSCWMTYVSAEIYGLAWVRGDPMRIVSDERQASVVLDRIAERRARCWHLMDEQVEPAKFLLGDELSVLDLYVATVSRWTPRRRRFYREAPKMAEAVRRVDAEPRLAKLWNTRFPFIQGWDD